MKKSMITKRKNDTTIALLTKLIFEYLVSKLEQNFSQYMSCQIFNSYYTTKVLSYGKIVLKCINTRGPIVLLRIVQSVLGLFHNTRYHNTNEDLLAVESDNAIFCTLTQFCENSFQLTFYNSLPAYLCVVA